MKKKKKIPSTLQKEKKSNVVRYSTTTGDPQSHVHDDYEPINHEGVEMYEVPK